MPAEIAKYHPGLWVDESAAEGKNEQEKQLVRELLRRTGREYSFSYHKVNSHQEGEQLLSRFPALRSNDLNIIVFNFIDALSHARADSKMIASLSATRRTTGHSPARGSLARPWKNPPGNRKPRLQAIITTDHGTVRVKNGVTVVGDRRRAPSPLQAREKPLVRPKKSVSLHPAREHRLPSPILARGTSRDELRPPIYPTAGAITPRSMRTRFSMGAYRLRR